MSGEPRLGVLRRCSTVLACLWWLGLGGPLSAQVGAGALTGTLSDPSGGAIPGAVVTVVATLTNRSREAVSGADGVFVVHGLAPCV